MLVLKPTQGIIEKKKDITVLPAVNFENSNHKTKIEQNILLL